MYHYSCDIVILDNMYSYLKIKLKIAITALNCSDDLASWGYHTASTMMSNRMLTMSMSKDKMTERQEHRMRLYWDRR